MPSVITEDEIYRTSSQYRLWSFTPEALASLRKTANEAAAERILVAIDNQKASRNSTDDGSTNTSNEDSKAAQEGETAALAPTPLSTTEELKYLTHHIQTLLKIASQPAYNLSTPVKATAAIYLKRFYLSHSAMTYPPKSIIPTCIFLAMKTENAHSSLSNFAAKWKPAMTADDVIKHESAVTQALRFCFDVRHPFRGLRGLLMELMALATGKDVLGPDSENSLEEAQEEMLSLPPPDADNPAAPATKVTVKHAQDRAFQAHDKAREILSSAALLTDAYFLYTPSQIMFASMLLADEPLTQFYLSTKFPATKLTFSSKTENEPSVPFPTKVLAQLRACAALLSAPMMPDRNELIDIDKKLYQCRNVEKKNSAAVNVSAKRNGNLLGPDDADEKAAKKRKVETEDGSVFGGPLGTPSKNET